MCAPKTGDGSLKRESAVKAFAVVVLDVNTRDAFEVPAAHDQQPVETLVADSADESLCVGVRLTCTGVQITLVPSQRNSSSKAAVNLLSRSWISTRQHRPDPALAGDPEARRTM
jgi:hypothetical protein